MKKLELGCGENKGRGIGWEYLDSRPLEHVDYVQDARDLSNFDSDTYDKVLSENLIEHIPWREVVPTLKEWLRIVKPGGVLEIATPNAHELAAQITDPDNVLLKRWENESDWERFSRTAFGHQDYEGNFHTTYFTKEWLEGLLKKAGARHTNLIEETLENIRMEAIK